MIILGVDPGSICTGYGIINFDNNELGYVSSGLVKPPAVKDISPRLGFIYDELQRIIKAYKPDEISIETAFYGKNVQSALKIGYVRGVVLLAAYHNNILPGEYSPREVKKSVVGSGGASKEQILYMIKKLLYIRKENIKFDESDALAVAVCHAFKSNSLSKQSGSWKSFIEANPDRIIE